MGISSVDEIKKYLKNVLSEKRFYHSECVMEMCEELAKIYNEDIEKAKLVGIAHDVAKEMPTEEKFKYIEDNNIEADNIEKRYPTLLHAKIGADIAVKKFGFTDDMGQAIICHTTAKANMTMLDKILYIADWIGIDRHFEDTEYLRNLAKNNIDEAIIYSLNSTIKEKLENQEEIHLDSVMALNYLLGEKNKNK